MIVSKVIEGKRYAEVRIFSDSYEDGSFEEHISVSRTDHLNDANAVNFQEETFSLSDKQAVKFSYEIPDIEITFPGNEGVKLGERISEIYIPTGEGKLFFLVGSAIREKDTYYPIVEQILSTFAL